MKKSCILLLIVVTIGVIEQVNTNPSKKSAISSCFQKQCPFGTKSCVRRTSMTSNKKNLIHIISCLNLNGDKLQVYKDLEKPSFPLDNVSLYETYAYTAVFEFGNSDEEKFPKMSGPSEVDDMNKYV